MRNGKERFLNYFSAVKLYIRIIDLQDFIVKRLNAYCGSPRLKPHRFQASSSPQYWDEAPIFEVLCDVKETLLDQVFSNFAGPEHISSNHIDDLDCGRRMDVQIHFVKIPLGFDKQILE